MDALIRPLEADDRPSATRLLDDAVGADFYAESSVASKADCPYCGAPPCRCEARPFVKVLAPA